MSGQNQTLLTQYNSFQGRYNALPLDGAAADKITILHNLQTLNHDMSTAIKSAMKNGDTQGVLGEFGSLRQQIAQLTVQHEEAQESADTALARKKSVEDREKNVSYHQLFLVNRPVKELSIPTLLVVSIILMILGMRWLYLVYYGVGTGPVSFSLLTGFGTALIKAGTALSGSTNSSGFTTYGIGQQGQPSWRLPGQGLTSQLGL
jgi:hypothetical protein